MAYGTAFIPTLNHWICHIKQKTAFFDFCGTVSCRRHVFIIFDNQTYFKYVMRPKTCENPYFLGHFKAISSAVLYMRLHGSFTC